MQVSLLDQAQELERLAWTARDLDRQVSRIMRDREVAQSAPGDVYSHRRALLASGEGAMRTQAPGEWAASEREGERYGAKPKLATGYFVPNAIVRALTAAGDGAGLVATAASGEVAAPRGSGSFLDLCTRVPATALGNLNIPRMSAPTAYVLADESTQITAGAAVAATHVATSHSVGAYQEHSRQIVVQGGEAIARGIARSVLVSARDKAQDQIIAGSGSGGQVLGLLNDPAVTVVSGTTVAYDDFCAVAKAVEQNAGGAALTWVLSAGAAEIARQRLTASGATPILGELMTISGHPVIVVAGSSNYAVLGAWADLLVIDWAPIEVAANPFANFQAAISGVRALHLFDAVAMRPASFACISSIT